MKLVALLFLLFALLSPSHAQEASKVVTVQVEQTDYIVDGKTAHSEAEVIDLLRHIEGLKSINLRVAKDAPYERVAGFLTALQRSDLPISIGLVGNEAPN
jgi:biopolymer transport protein ExbD